MNEKEMRLTLAVVCGGGLSFLYAGFLYAFVANGAFFPRDWVEVAILGAAVVKACLIFGLKKVRRGGALLIIDLLFAEILTLPGILLLFAVFGGEFLFQLPAAVLFAWMTGTLLILPAISVFFLVSWVLRGDPAFKVIGSSMMNAGIIVLAWGVAVSPSSIQGFEGFTRLLLTAEGAQLEGASNGILSGLGGAAVMVVLYLSLLVYAVLGRAGQVSSTRLLAGCLLSTVAALSWTAEAATFSHDYLIVLALPSLGLTTVTWWLSRAR